MVLISTFISGNHKKYTLPEEENFERAVNANASLPYWADFHISEENKIKIYIVKIKNQHIRRAVESNALSRIHPKVSHSEKSDN